MQLDTYFKLLTQCCLHHQRVQNIDSLKQQSKKKHTAPVKKVNKSSKTHRLQVENI